MCPAYPPLWPRQTACMLMGHHGTFVPFYSSLICQLQRSGCASIGSPCKPPGDGRAGATRPKPTGRAASAAAAAAAEARRAGPSKCIQMRRSVCAAGCVTTGTGADWQLAAVALFHLGGWSMDTRGCAGIRPHASFIGSTHAYAMTHMATVQARLFAAPGLSSHAIPCRFWRAAANDTRSPRHSPQPPALRP